jgi:hypothetical protein
MAIKATYFGESATDKIVMEWMQRNGIKPDRVTGYTISRGNGGAFDSTIALTMHFEDSPASIEESNKE